ncbi:MAG: class I SAM-dependent methyltransferase [Solirubrobacteraceae bacterium]
MTPAHDDPGERFAGTRDYIRARGEIPLQAHQPEFDTQLRRFAKLVATGPGTRLLEIGPGTGWLLVHAALRGLHCTGLEHNPELAGFARARARQHGVDVEIEVGDIQDGGLAPESFDIVVANSVLEHVRDARRALEHVHRALRPGGLFYFNSTNKFAPRSGEYPPLRLYGWLPYGARRRIRVARQGERVVDAAEIDFHQFTHPGLRRELGEVGFRRVASIYELLEVEDLNDRASRRVLAMRAYKSLPPLRHVIETFATGTSFYCVK